MPTTKSMMPQSSHKMLISQNTTLPKKIMLMNRTDGLGERLCSMINSIRLADRLDAEFKLHWTSDVWNPIYHKLDVDERKAVLGQSIGPADELFSSDYLGRHSVSSYDKNRFKEFPEKPVTLKKIKKAEADGKILGWKASQNFLEAEFDQDFINSIKLSSVDAFSKIEFSPRIADVIRIAKSIDIGPFLALHMRSGDMVFGEVRKWGFWSDKVLNPSVAKSIIGQAKEKGQRVAIFGQDVDTLAMLRDEYGAILPHEIASGLSLDVTQKALFEIFFMSRAEIIIGGNSGFARAASMIGGKKLIGMFSLYSPLEYSNITLEDLKTYGDQYHALVTAYSYWQSYAFGRSKRSAAELSDIISKASKYDPKNLFYRIIHAALQYRIGADAKGEMELAALLADHSAGVSYDEHPAIKQLVFKYYVGQPSHKEQFDDFLRAAQRVGNSKAKIFAEAINKSKL